MQRHLSLRTSQRETHSFDFFPCFCKRPYFSILVEPFVTISRGFMSPYAFYASISFEINLRSWGVDHSNRKSFFFIFFLIADHGVPLIIVSSVKSTSSVSVISAFHTLKCGLHSLIYGKTRMPHLSSYPVFVDKVIARYELRPSCLTSLWEEGLTWKAWY